MAEERFEMRVDVNFFVRRVLEEVEASRVHDISILKLKCYDIVTRLVEVLVWDLNTLSVKGDCTIFNSIHHYFANQLSLKVNEKGDLCFSILGFFQVKSDLVYTHIATF